MYTDKNHHLARLLYGQNVAIIGGGEFVSPRAHEANIVVRVNDKWQPADRIDGLYSSMPQPPERIDRLKFLAIKEHTDRDSKVAWFDFALRHKVDVHSYFHERFRAPNPLGPEMEWSNVFNHEIQTMPLTGIVAARHLTLFPIKSLYITGMDFYLDEGVVPYMRHSHLLWPQVEWLHHLVQTDHRVTVDAKLDSILKDEFKFESIQKVTRGPFTYVIRGGRAA